RSALTSATVLKIKRGAPARVVPKHRVEHDQEFAGAGNIRKLLELPAFEQTAIEGCQYRIAAARTEHRHIEGGANSGAATPDHPATLELAALVSMRCDSDQ